MDTSRVSQGELIAGVSGLLLFVFTFLNWFEPSTSAWEAFDIVDVLLAIIGLGVAAVVGARASGTMIGIAPVSLAIGGLVALSMVLTFVLEAEGREIGLWLALTAAAGITYGGYQALAGPRTRTATTTTTTREPPPPPPPAV
jgi:TRAP-type uncharacterized transport system fused permease subunit